MTKPLSLSSGIFLLLAVLYFFGGLEFLLGFIFAVAAHEMGHIFAIKLCGGSIRAVYVKINGAAIECYGLNGILSELLSIIAGPAAGLLFAYITSLLGNHYLNKLLLSTAGISLILSVYNLLPILPLDGGRILKVLLSCCLRENISRQIMALMGMIISMFLILTGVINIRNNYGLALLIAGIWTLTAQTGIVKNKRVL